MSHASVDIKFKDGTILYGEYNGTSDIMLTNIFDTPEERNNMWRKQEWKTCKCNGEKIECDVISHYGGGSSWTGKACLQCKVYCGPYEPWEDCPDMKHDLFINPDRMTHGKD